ncbi:hypothetical protein T492DRAFT_1013507 [Pavlovales sp. CCMP2436]|nr:hypothetical protein T492DRAFT_1013507 [Pavlovales sp. CCMP2436]
MSSTDRLDLSLDELIKTSKQERVAARTPAPDKAAQVKARSQALRAEKVGKARGMEVDAAPRGGGRAPIVKPRTKAVKASKVTVGQPRPTQQARRGGRGKGRGTVGTPKTTGVIVQVRADGPPRGSPARVSPAVVRGGRGAGARTGSGSGGGGGGGGRKVLVQPGARAPVPASKAGGRGASAGKGSRNKSSAKNGGRAGGIVKPTPRAPVQTFGSKTANVAAQAAAGNSSPRGGRSGGGGKAANVGKVGKVRGGRQ